MFTAKSRQPTLVILKAQFQEGRETKQRHEGKEEIKIKAESLGGSSSKGKKG